MQRMYDNCMQSTVRSGSCNSFSRDNDCAFKKLTALPEYTSVAMAYIPFQTNTDMYEEMKALESGTLFPCLNKPFMGCGCR